MKCWVTLIGSGVACPGQMEMLVDGLDIMVEGRFVAVGDDGNLKVAEGRDMVVGWVDRLVMPEGCLAVFRERVL